MRLVRSNSIEVLFQQLKNHLFHPEADPWMRRIVIVQNVQIKEWLTEKLATDLGIAAGIECFLPGRAMELFQKIPSPLELTLQIEAVLETIDSEPLGHYLHGKSQKRKVALAEELARLFLQYMSAQENTLTGFQKNIWDALTFNLLKEPVHPTAELFLFAVPFLSPLEYKFFGQSASAFFQLSPCAMYWQDFISDRKRGYLDAAFEPFLEDHHPLLSNLGALGQKTDLTLDLYGYTPEEEFFENEEGSALDMLKADMLLLQTPRVVPSDHSIQFHMCNSIRREVEIVHERILDLTQKENIHPKEIVVMAPDLTPYVPYLEVYFPRAKIKDVNAVYLFPLIRSFLHLLSLSETRWDLSSFLQLLEEPAFCKKAGLSHGQVEDVKRWMEQAGIQWGESPAHRDELLKKDQCHIGMVEKTKRGTWEEGCEKLLKGLIMDGDVSIELSSFDTFSKWLLTIDQLRADLKVEGEKTVEQWCQYFTYIYKKYFDSEGGEGERLLIQQIQTLKKAGFGLDHLFPYASALYHLKKMVGRQKTTRKSPDADGLTFCTLQSVPAKAIILMGMNEESFPRQNRHTSLNQLKTKALPDQTEKDRYLFLELLLQTEYRFICSYTHLPSSIVTELMQQIKEPLIVEHPFDSFDRKYFNGELTSYSFENYCLAKALEEKVPEVRTSLFTIQPHNPPQVDTLSISRLFAHAKNPLKTFFQEKAGVYLERSKVKPVEVEETLLLDSLNRAILKNEAFGASFSEKLGEWNKQELLPIGGFKSVTIEKIKQESEVAAENMKQMEIDPQLFEISLSERHQEPAVDSSGNWLLPPLIVQNIQLVGTLKNISSKGIVVPFKTGREEHIRHWPQILVLDQLVKKYALPIDPSLVFIKNQKIFNYSLADSSQQLEAYLNYYFLSLENLSPLIPEWVVSILFHSPNRLAKKIQSQMGGLDPLYNDYARMLLQSREETDAFNMIENWKPYAERLFSEMLPVLKPRGQS
ncbi:MAG: exodeoxyribonuclease V subunit gamma [Waddliaceae bacterium]